VLEYWSDAKAPSSIHSKQYSITPLLQYSILLETRQQKPAIPLPLHLETEHHDGLSERPSKKEIHPLYPEPEFPGQKRSEMKVEFQKLQDLLHSLLPILRDLADIIREEGITASLFLFLDQTEENSVFYEILSVELGTLIECHELSGVPTLEAGTLGGPVYVDAARLFLCSVEDTASLFSPDFNHLLISRDEPPLNIVPHEFTSTNGIKMLQPDSAANNQSQILLVQSRAGAKTALPAADTMCSELPRNHASHFTRPQRFGKKKTPLTLIEGAKGV